MYTLVVSKGVVYAHALLAHVDIHKKLEKVITMEDASMEERYFRVRSNTVSLRPFL